MNTKKKLSQNQKNEILKILKDRFDKNQIRHKKLDWDNILEKLNLNPEKLWSLNEMERTGGEPDVLGYNQISNEYFFVDCSLESPSGRRSVCFDKEALDLRKDNKPVNDAISLANYIGIDILNEKEYREFQKIINFDNKTSSWIKTPNDIRKLGGALFADFRYNNVFVYHNGASSYYAARGFRGILKV